MSVWKSPSTVGRVILWALLAVTLLGPGIAAAEEDSYALSLDVAPKLCRIVLDLAEKVSKSDGNLCGFPGAGAANAIKPLDWTSIPPEQIDALLALKLPKNGWDTRKSLTAFWADGKAKGMSQEDILAVLWAKFGPAMLETLQETPDSLRMAHEDVDNDGVAERVYQVITLEPNDVNDASKGWHPLACGRRGEPSPYISYFFDPETDAAMGLVSRLDIAENARLVRYSNKTYRADMGPTMVALYKIQPFSRGAFIDPICTVITK